MKTLYKTYIESIEEFEKAYKPKWRKDFDAGDTITIPSEVYDVIQYNEVVIFHLKTTYLSFIDVEIECLEGMIEESIKYPMFSVKGKIDNYNKGYKTSLTDRVTTLKEQRKLVEDN